MHNSTSDSSIDYLLIGHLSCDRTPTGFRLGGSVAYAALTARALGLRPGIVTAWGGEIPLDDLEGIPLRLVPTEHSTAFENIETPTGRRQFLHSRATLLSWEHIPPAWRHAPLVHLAPIADEVPPTLAQRFPHALVCATPQGWMRRWDADGRVSQAPWVDARQALPHLNAVTLSREALGGAAEPPWAQEAQILVITAGSDPVTVCQGTEKRWFMPPTNEVVDPTGAGDIFAAAFFVALYRGHSPWRAAEFANQFASRSITRRGLDGVPRLEEITTTAKV